MERKVTWQDVRKWNPQRIIFDSAGLQCPPQSIHPGHMAQNKHLHALCSKNGTLKNILSSFSKTLSEGRYYWRHDKVLRSNQQRFSDSRYTHSTAKMSVFIKETEQPKKRVKGCSVVLLAMARDWVIAVDLERQLKIATHIIQSSLRPDIILVSEATRQHILWELIVLWEERIEEVQERKRPKHQELGEDCHRKGWRTRCMPVKVGSRGFASHSLSKAYGTLGSGLDEGVCCKTWNTQ